MFGEVIIEEVVSEFDCELVSSLQWLIASLCIRHHSLLRGKSVTRSFGFADFGVYGTIRFTRDSADNYSITGVFSGNGPDQFGELVVPYCPYVGFDEYARNFVDFVKEKVLV